MQNELFLGLDLGTGGARCVAVTLDGQIATSASVDLPAGASQVVGDRHEQQPEAWWQAAVDVLQSTVEQLKQSGWPVDSIQALAVDGTSGTVVLVDAELNPLGAALMYNDGRAVAQADRLNDEQAAFCVKLGYRFASSFALAKVFWLAEHERERLATARWIAHQADFVAWRLMRQGGTTDYSNALKTGYDLIDDQWPDWLAPHAEIRERLPSVVAPGDVIGQLHADAAVATGLPPGIKIVAGCTDGTAGVLASGARNIGDDNTTLGTTLVFKRIADAPAQDPQGLVYSHKLPGGRWLPGAASNVGGGWIRQCHGGQDLTTLDQQVAESLFLPCNCLAYPLTKRGERFPFLSESIEAFMEPSPFAPLARYAANLQGTAFVERLGYEVLDGTTGQSAHGDVYATGGGSRSNVWMQLRADVTDRTLHRPTCSEAAFGAAVLAAAGTQEIDLWQASRSMVKVDRTFVPLPAMRAEFDDAYGRFKQILVRDGHIDA